MKNINMIKVFMKENEIDFDKRNVDLDAMILSGIENFKSKSWSDAEMYCEAHFRRIVLDSETIIYGNEWIGNE